MPRGGWRPNSGRPKGVPTVPPMTAEATEPTRQRIVKGSEQSPLETMLFKRNYWMQVVSKAMPKLIALVAESEAANDPEQAKDEAAKEVARQAAKNRDGRITKLRSMIEHALDKAEESAVRAARYIHPALASMQVRHEAYDLSRLTDAQLAQLERILTAATPGAGGRARDAAPTQH